MAVSVLLVALVGCAPMAVSPVGRGGDRICQWVRDAVAGGQMTVNQAMAWYSRCAPFEVPR